MYDCTNKSCLSHCYEHFGIKHVYNFLHLCKVLDDTRCQNLAFFTYRDNFLNFNANLDKNADWDKDEITIILLKKNLFFHGMAKRSSDFEISCKLEGSRVGYYAYCFKPNYRLKECPHKLKSSLCNFFI